MKNLANVLAVLLMVIALGLMVGCGCGTATDRTEEDMVGNTTEASPDTQSTMQEDMSAPESSVGENDTAGDEDTENNAGDMGNTMEETNPIDGSTLENGTDSGLLEDAGNAVGDVIDGVGNAVEDVGDGVKDASR